MTSDESVIKRKGNRKCCTIRSVFLYDKKHDFILQGSKLLDLFQGISAQDSASAGKF